MRSPGLPPSCQPPCLLPGLSASSPASFPASRPLSAAGQQPAGTPCRSLTAPVREMVAPAVSEQQPCRAGPGRAGPRGAELSLPPTTTPSPHGVTYVKTKNKVVEPTSKAAAVETGMYFVGLNLLPVLLGILWLTHHCAEPSREQGAGRTRAASGTGGGRRGGTGPADLQHRKSHPRRPAPRLMSSSPLR